MARRRMTLGARIGFLALLAGAFSIAAIGPARQAVEQRRAIEVEQRKLAALTAGNARLAQELQRLNDQEYLEKEAREQLGLVRPGETSYIVERPIVPPKPKAPPSEPAPWYGQVLDRLLSILR